MRSRHRTILSSDAKDSFPCFNVCSRLWMSSVLWHSILTRWCLSSPYGSAEKGSCNASRIRNIPPIRQTLLHRAQCRMLVQLIFNIIGLQEAQHFAPQPAAFQFIDFHLRFCFGCKFGQFFGYGNENSKTAYTDSSYFRIFRLTDTLGI